MIRRPPRSTLSSSSAASDVYKRQGPAAQRRGIGPGTPPTSRPRSRPRSRRVGVAGPVSYTHLRAHETPEHLVCRLLLEKKKKKQTNEGKHQPRRPNKKKQAHKRQNK